MDEQQQRLVEDLSGVFRGELRCDPLSLSLYSNDGSLYQIRPLAVALPRDEDDVITLAKYSTDANIPLIPRGAGTGVAGGCLGAGIVVDFSRHMARIIEIGDGTVRVQPGVVRNQLNNALREHGVYFAPDPANSDFTTLGGTLGVDGAGSHAVRVGSARDHVQSIRCVLASGDVFDAGLETTSNVVGGGDARNQIVSKLGKILSDHRDLIRERQPPLIRNCCGYYLRNVLRNDRIDLPRLLVGSEGTLAMFTEATLHTLRISPVRGLALLLFGRLEDGISAVRSVIPSEPSACDLMDRRLLSLGREADPRFESWISPAAEAALIVEHIGDSEREVRQRMADVISAVRTLPFTVVVAREVYGHDAVEELWSLPRRVVPMLTRLEGTARPQPFVEDVAVPPEELGAFLTRALRVLQKQRVTASLYSHAASGQVHLRPFLPMPTRETASQLETIARDLYQAVLLFGGTISGEHGDGLSRSAFVRAQYGPLFNVFRQIKDVFDPHNLLNPGKIICDDPHLTIRNLRPEPKALPDDGVQLQLLWDTNQKDEKVACDAAIARCNGCGTCKTTGPGYRMCPFNRLHFSEDHSPRSKVTALRQLLAAQLDESEVATTAIKDLASLCFNCKQCRLECPSEVDVPHMVMETRAQYVAANGLARADWLLSRAHSFGSLGTVFSPMMNWLLRQPSFRWVLEKTMGIARRRKLPPFAGRAFVRRLPRRYTRPRAPEESPGSVVFFVDHFVNAHDPAIGDALIKLLEAAGIDVHVPRKQTGSGLAMISAGDLDAARNIAERNLRVLGPFAREGWPIVCTEPAAVVCFREEYPRLIDHPDVAVVASSVVEAGAFLHQLVEEKKLPLAFDDSSSSGSAVTLGYHTPCHLKVISPQTAFADLLRNAPGLDIQRIEKGCSGMAGTFGLTAKNYETSLAIGEPLMQEFQENELAAGTTECSSCKIQMEQQTSLPTIHPAKLLASSLGLMPEIATLLTPNKSRLLTTR